MSYSFPKRLRLTHRRGFRRVARYGVRHSGTFIALELNHNPRAERRIGITVSRRYGKAHERNRFKRLVREAFRLIQHSVPLGTECVVHPRSAAHSCTLGDIQNDLKRLLKVED